MVDLWPPELKVAEVKSPVAILREQAALLKGKTEHEIEADRDASLAFSMTTYNVRLSY